MQAVNLIADEFGFVCLPDGGLLICHHPEGDVDTINAKDPDIKNLRRALYDCRECGLIEPNVEVFVLPDGSTLKLGR
jgi:hypothetical protein